MKNKNILTIETSLGRIFLSIIKHNNFFSYAIDSPRSIEQDFNKLLENLINEANIKFNQIDYILVSLGPGSFTGIRIGISVAKALSISTGAKVIGYSNFDSILQQFLSKNKKAERVEVLIKGPGDEFYKKIFNKNKFDKKSYLVTEKELQDENYKSKTIKIGSFLNNFKIKNYNFCLPSQLGVEGIVRKLLKNVNNYNFKDPEPIYIKEHYAKKTYQ